MRKKNVPGFETHLHLEPCRPPLTPAPVVIVVVLVAVVVMVMVSV